jgi:hypothetical protein
METDYWIGELGRLYERSSEAIEEGHSDAVEPLSEEFNEAIDQLKTEFPDNEIVSTTDPVDAYTEDHSSSSGSTVVISPPTRRDEALHEIRSRCEKIANALDYELPERESGTRQSDQMVMVSVEQESTQEVNQEVTVESIMQLIDVDPTVQGNRADLRGIVEEFEEELDKEDSDEGRLRQFIEEAKEYSTSVAAKMGIQALQAGVTEVLSL